ncbi:MarR family winged helix-turn-helix transcriptional regulator [Marinobacterium rhizophilum]|uniref:MarR family transcriptional regulator n=1 Tax=Marinobacterium rhizophilum TaxID=420402 RepID=A0ABY5HHH5_9GAMM|nr:MarR family transcriptional regulator [Marinobacterium rhizophilum]UTW11287.1 MarR family transcriptional regulator [Marinobacterium rhizophilum]
MNKNHQESKKPDREGFENPMPLWRRPGFLIRRAHQIHQALFIEECSEFNLTPIQYGLLTELADNPDIDQISLAREVGIDRTNVADVLRRLENRGLIVRKTAEHDRRMRLVSLTDEGMRVLKDMFESMRSAQAKLMAPLSASEADSFLELLHRLVMENNHLGRTDFKPK